MNETSANLTGNMGELKKKLTVKEIRFIGQESGREKKVYGEIEWS